MILREASLSGIENESGLRVTDMAVLVSLILIWLTENGYFTLREVRGRTKIYLNNNPSG